VLQGKLPNWPLQQANATRLRSQVDLCRDAAGCAHGSLAAVVRSKATLAFAAERQNVSRSSFGDGRRSPERPSRCRGRSLAATWSKCHGPNGMEPWSHGRPRGGTADVIRAGEPRRTQDVPGSGDLTRLEDRDIPHLRDLNGLRSDELALQLRLAVLE
jgi:hypothetical protein